MDYINSKVKKFNELNLFSEFKNDEDLLINKIQSEVISFCRDNYNLQNNSSFYDINFRQQIKFNNCVETCINQIKNEYEIINQFYDSCKEMHLDEYKNNLCKNKKDNLMKYYSDYLIYKKAEQHILEGKNR